MLMTKGIFYTYPFIGNPVFAFSWLHSFILLSTTALGKEAGKSMPNDSWEKGQSKSQLQPHFIMSLRVTHWHNGIDFLKG